MSDDIDFRILGDDLQIVEIELDPGETVIAEAGAMNCMGDGTKPPGGFWDQALSAGKRLLAGESLFLTHFHNAGSTKRTLAFAAPYPGVTIPLDLGTLGGVGLFLADLSGTGTVYLQSLSFSRLARRVLQSLRRRGGFGKGEGSILEGLGNILMGGQR